MPDLGHRIRTASIQLRAFLNEKKTESVVGFAANYHVLKANDVDDLSGLHSKYRQIAFLLGVLLSTPEPAISFDVSQEEWDNTVKELNAIYDTYMELFFPSSDEVKILPPEWRRVREVAMPAFMHHFFSGILASVDQIRDRIRRYVIPFDAEIENQLGITATRALETADWIAASLQSAMDRAHELASQEKSARMTLLADSRNLKEIRARAEETGYSRIAHMWADAIHRIYKVNREEMVQALGGAGENFWKIFSIARGEGPELLYPTEGSIIETKPLIRLGSSDAMCVTGNSLYLGVLRACEQTLINGPARQQFLSHRDDELERETADVLRRLLGANAQIYRSVYEQPDSQFEHDIVAVLGNTAFIVEAKASPPTEPFRDPDKAFTRITRGFKADGGIQKAFDQGSRITRRLSIGESVALYTRGGEHVVTLRPSELQKWYAIVVTRDDYGALATDLALLLEKETTDRYPWAVNIFDFDAVADAWSYLKWDPARLMRYIDERGEANGRMFSTDELDFVGCYIRHGSLRPLMRNKRDLIVLDPRYSNFFDELYQHLRYGAEAPRSDVGQPFVTDFKKSLVADRPVFVSQDTSEVSVGRNSPCPCGSGKKFKRCCGAH